MALFIFAVAPQIGSFTFGDDPLNAGETASLTCLITKGDSPLEIVWMFNNEPVDPTQHDIVISETGKRTKQLTIDPVSARHAGEYTCIASNIAGSTSRSAQLIVNGILNCLKCWYFKVTRMTYIESKHMTINL